MHAPRAGIISDQYFCESMPAHITTHHHTYTTHQTIFTTTPHHPRIKSHTTYHHHPHTHHISTITHIHITHHIQIKQRHEPKRECVSIPMEIDREGSEHRVRVRKTAEREGEEIAIRICRKTRVVCHQAPIITQKTHTHSHTLHFIESSYQQYLETTSELEETITSKKEYIFIEQLDQHIQNHNTFLCSKHHQWRHRNHLVIDFDTIQFYCTAHDQCKGTTPMETQREAQTITQKTHILPLHFFIPSSFQQWSESLFQDCLTTITQLKEDITKEKKTLFCQYVKQHIENQDTFPCSKHQKWRRLRYLTIDWDKVEFYCTEGDECQLNPHEMYYTTFYRR